MGTAFAIGGRALFYFYIVSLGLRSRDLLLGLCLPGLGTTGVEVRADMGLACVFVYLRSLSADGDVLDALFTMLSASSLLHEEGALCL